MRVCYGWAVIAACILAGCRPPGTVAPVLDEKGSLALAQQFGDAVLANQWDKAYALTAPEFQAVHPLREFEDKYWRLASSIRTGGMKFAPDTVKVRVEHMPASEKEAEESFGMTPVPPYGTWRGRVSAEIGKSVGGGQMELGSDIYCRMLVVQSGGGLGIGYVSIEFAG